MAVQNITCLNETFTVTDRNSRGDPTTKIVDERQKNKERGKASEKEKPMKSERERKGKRKSERK